MQSGTSEQELHVICEEVRIYNIQGSNGGDNRAGVLTKRKAHNIIIAKYTHSRDCLQGDNH